MHSDPPSQLQGVPKKVGVTATITSSNSQFFLGHPVEDAKEDDIDMIICDKDS